MNFRANEIARWCAAALAACVAMGTPVAAFSQAGAPYVIGAHAPLSGPLAPNGEALSNAYKLAVQEINDAGGIRGRKLELVIEDDKGDPTTVRNVVTKLVTERRANVVLGGSGTPSGLASSTEAEKLKVLNIQPFAASSMMASRGSKYIVNLHQSAGDAGPIFGKFITTTVKPQSVAILWVNNDWGEEITKYLVGQMKGVNIVYNESFESGSRDLTGPLTKIKSLKPDTLLVAEYPADTIQILRSMKALNFAPTNYLSVSPFILDTAIATTLGGLEDWGVGQWEWLVQSPIPESRKFVEAYRVAYKKDPIATAVKGYQAIQVLAYGLQNTSGEWNSENVRATILASDGLKTVTGPLTFTPAGQANVPSVVVQNQNRKPIIISPDSLAQGKLMPFKGWNER